MSTDTASALKSRLRMAPIDEWSTREKLCLASSVLKSGDQNWSSVSRPLKSFSEPNRPNDWFHTKLCALQYQSLLEKLETETPKRKRSERGEETNETIIVRNLTKQRIEELKQITQTERETIAKMKRDLEAIKNNKMSDKRLQELTKEIKDKEESEKQREVEHKKYLEEREVKIAQMTRKGSFLPRKVTPSTPTTPSTPVSTSAQSANTSVDSEAKSPINEPLKVEVDSEANAVQNSQTNPTTESKLSLALTSPSTSPLLTSLLQSPTPSSPSILSPTKTGLSVNGLNRSKPISQVATPIPITRRPSIHSMSEKSSEVTPNESKDASLSSANLNMAAHASEQNQTKTSVESSKLSKLLETPETPKTKTNAIDARTDVKPQIVDNKPSVSEPTTSSATTAQEVEIIDSQTKSNVSTKKPEDVHKNDETNERLLRSSEKASKEKAEAKSDDLKDNSVDQTTDNGSNDTIENVSIKQEVMETNEEEKEMEKTSVKEEPMDVTEDDSNPRTPVMRSNNKRNRKTPHPISITPTAMRRSRRVALKDQKSATDDSTEMSDQSAANTPQAVKKRGSVDETTETSMSEESMEARTLAPTASIDTVPNSPASVRTEDMSYDTKEYQLWKKAIMVNWRRIASHKNASLFAHAVTEADAKGYDDIVHQPMDLASIKRRVENGQIRNTLEYERDILLMFQNAIMFNNVDHDVHKMAVDMQKDSIDSIEEFIEAQKHDNQSSESKLRARERRSNVSAVVANETEISGRRKSRGASTDTDSNASTLTKSVTKNKKKS